MSPSPEGTARRLSALRRFTAVQAASVAAKLGALLLLAAFLSKYVGGL
jgi:hypothetical protein